MIIIVDLKNNTLLQKISYNYIWTIIRSVFLTEIYKKSMKFNIDSMCTQDIFSIMCDDISYFKWEFMV